MDIPFTGIGAFIDCLVLLFFYYKLNSHPSANNKFITYFKGYALFFSMFYMLFSIPLLLFPADSFTIGIGYLIGHAFAYVAFGYLARIALLLAKPSFNSMSVFVVYLIIGAALTVLNTYLFNYPVVVNGVAQWNQYPVVGALIVITGLSVFLPVAVLFIKEAVKQPKNRKRYGLIGTAVLLMILSGPLHDVATTATVLIVADVVTTAAFIMMFAGVATEPQVSKVQSKVLA